MTTSGRRQLYLLRTALIDMRRAHRSMVDAGLVLGVGSLKYEIDRLAEREMEFQIPCILCRRPVPHTVKVDSPEDAYPNTALCGQCNAETEAEVREGYGDT